MLIKEVTISIKQESKTVFVNTSTLLETISNEIGKIKPVKRKRFGSIISIDIYKRLFE